MFQAKQKRGPCDPRFRRSFFVGGLRDDLGSLHEDRDGDRGKQNESGGESADLGHLGNPSEFECFVSS